MNGDIVASFVLILSLITLCQPQEPPPVKRRRRGLELKARNGRLVHVRETESEREI